MQFSKTSGGISSAGRVVVDSAVVVPYEGTPSCGMSLTGTPTVVVDFGGVMPVVFDKIVVEVEVVVVSIVGGGVEVIQPAIDSNIASNIRCFM